MRVKTQKGENSSDYQYSNIRTQNNCSLKVGEKFPKNNSNLKIILAQVK